MTKTKNGGEAVALDLFGLPLTPPRGRGRPSHEPTRYTRRKVMTLRQAGLGQDQIADALGISLPTLRLYYHRELGSSSQLWRRRVGPHLKGDEHGN